MTAPKPTPCIVFDFDGTLVDSAPGILTAMTLVLQEYGIEPQVALEPGIIGPPLLKTLALISGKEDEQTLAVLAASFKQHYDGRGYRDTVPYQGVDQALRGLKGNGTRLMLATNKRGAPTKLILDYLDWAGLFDSVYCLDEHSGCVNKGAMLAKLLAEQNLPSNMTAYIGDTEGDRQAAASNGMPFIYVNWGYGGRGMPQTKCLDTPCELLDL